MVRFLNDITGSNLLLYKVILTSIVFALAGVQVFFAARLWNVSSFPPISPAAAARVHRASGRLAVTLGSVASTRFTAAAALSPVTVMSPFIFDGLMRQK